MTVAIKFPPILDISHWIEVDNFNALSPKPWLIITKATQGEYFIDSQVAEYADEIRDAGIRLGLYHWIDPGDEIRQADFFCEIIQEIGLIGNEVLAVDLEVSGVTLAQVRRFQDRVQLKIGIRPVIYSRQQMIESLYPAGICPMWLKAEWLWIAEYPSAPDLTNIIPSWIIPRGLSVSNIALWQYSDDGIVTGIPGNNVDLNLINPSYLNFIKLTEPKPNEEQPMPETIKEGTVSVAKLGGSPYLNIRDGAGGSGLFNDIGNLYPRDRVFGNIVSAVWMEFNKIIRANGIIENFHGFASTQYMDLKDIPVEPPIPTPETTVTGATIRFSNGTSVEMIVKP